MHAATQSDSRPSRRRPRRLTVFAAAFVAGAAAAVGINRALDVHLAQTRPQVECEPIFVALRSLAQGSPVTVWDVALRDWPKAMLPTTAMRAEDSFEGCTLRHPLREGQPLLKVQLDRDDSRQARVEQPAVEPFTAPTPAAPVARAAEPDLWTPAATEQSAAATSAAPVPAAPPVAVAVPVQAGSVQAGSVTDVPPPDAPGGEPLAAAAERQSPVGEPGRQPGGEPTLADPQPGEPTLADTPPPVDTESVVAARSVTAPHGNAIPPGADPPADAQAAVATDGPPTPRQPRDGTVRYLVVPERIAMQADGGLAQPSAAAAERMPPTAALQPAPPARGRPADAASQPAASRSRSPTRGQPRPQASPSRQPQRQAVPPAARQPAAAPARGLGAMFPNLAAGLDAMTGRKPRAEEAEEAFATDGAGSPAR